MIRAILADDEVLARVKLRQLLGDEPDVEIVGESSSVDETIDLVRAVKPELLFLDIRMPGRRDAFDVVTELSSDPALPMPMIVFTTAYDQYALRAFDVHAADYLLKPFAEGRLRTAIDRVRQQLLNRIQEKNGPQASSPGGGKYFNRIVFKSHGRILFLPVSNIYWIGAEENYVRICTEHETHLVRETMSRIEAKLDPEMFLRIHRSAIVNLHFVKEVRTGDDNETWVFLTNGQKINMSRSYKARLKSILRQA